MLVKDINPILNVSEHPTILRLVREAQVGRRLWDWGNRPTFGSVGSGKVAIFLCKNGQGGRGKSELT